jgi:hypothetical protein
VIEQHGIDFSIKFKFFGHLEQSHGDNIG